MRNVLMLVCATVGFSLAASTAGLAGSPAPSSIDPAAVAKRCGAGLKHAVISGKHVCLKAGQRCKRKLDRRYHRYGFHCHGKRLTRRAPGPTPPPPPAASRPIAGPLVAGAYESQVFRPRVRFTVPAGWAGSGEGLDGFELIRREGDSGLSIGVTNHFRERPVGDTVAALAGVNGLSTTASSPVSIGGAAGQRLTVTVTAASPVTLYEEPGRYGWVLHPGDAARIDVISVRGETVVVIVEAPAVELAAFAAEADGVLATLSFP